MESMFGAFTSISVFIVLFHLQRDRMDIKKFLLTGVLLSIALDSVQYLSIGTHLFAAGISVLSLRLFTRFIKSGEVGEGVALVIALFVYYVLITLFAYWQQSSSVLGWALMWSSLGAALWSLALYQALKFATGWATNASQRQLSIRRN